MSSQTFHAVNPKPKPICQDFVVLHGRAHTPLFVFFVVIILERQVHSNPCINLTAVQPSGSQETHLSVFPFLMTSYFGMMLRGSRSAAVLITLSYILYMSRGGRPLQTPNEASYVSAGCQAGRRPE